MIKYINRNDGDIVCHHFRGNDDTISSNINEKCCQIVKSLKWITQLLQFSQKIYKYSNSTQYLFIIY